MSGKIYLLSAKYHENEKDKDKQKQLNKEGKKTIKGRAKKDKNKMEVERWRFGW